MPIFSQHLVFLVILNLLIMMILHVCFWISNIFSDHRFRPERPRILNILVFESDCIMTVLLILLLSSSKSTPSSSDDISDNINIIAGNLAEVSKELSSMQNALEARIKFVEDLKEQAEIAENVISLSEEQVNAVQAKLSQELEESSGKDILISILINIFFLTLGLVLPQIIKCIKCRKSTDNGNQ